MTPSWLQDPQDKLAFGMLAKAPGLLRSAGTGLKAVGGKVKGWMGGAKPTPIPAPAPMSPAGQFSAFAPKPATVGPAGQYSAFAPKPAAPAQAPGWWGRTKAVGRQAGNTMNAAMAPLMIYSMLGGGFGGGGEYAQEAQPAQPTGGVDYTGGDFSPEEWSQMPPAWQQHYSQNYMKPGEAFWDKGRALRDRAMNQLGWGGKEPTASYEDPVVPSFLKKKVGVRDKVAAVKPAMGGSQPRRYRQAVPNFMQKPGGSAKQAGWPQMLAKAISRLPSRAAKPGAEVYRGLNLDAGGAFNGVRHATLHPDVASRYATTLRGGLPLLQRFKVDPASQKHFTEFGLLNSLGHASHSQAAAAGRTLSQAKSFVQANPISVVSRGSATGQGYPDWFDDLPLSIRKLFLSPGKTLQRGLDGRVVDPRLLQKGLTYETGVTPSQYVGPVAYDAVKRRIVDIPANIAKDLPTLKQATLPHIDIPAGVYKQAGANSRYLARKSLGSRASAAELKIKAREIAASRAKQGLQGLPVASRVQAGNGSTGRVDSVALNKLQARELNLSKRRHRVSEALNYRENAEAARMARTYAAGDRASQSWLGKYFSSKKDSYRANELTQEAERLKQLHDRFGEHRLQQLRTRLRDSASRVSALRSKLESMPFLQRAQTQDRSSDVFTSSLPQLHGNNTRYKGFLPTAMAKVKPGAPLWYTPRKEVATSYALPRRPVVAVTDESALKGFGALGPVTPHLAKDNRKQITLPAKSSKSGRIMDHEQVATMPATPEKWFSSHKYYVPHSQTGVAREIPGRFVQPPSPPSLLGTVKNWFKPPKTAEVPAWWGVVAKQAALITFDDLDKMGIVVAGLAVQARDTGRVLMLQRAIDSKDPAGGMWEFPGGHLEEGESPLEAAKREWSEETGFEIPKGSLQSVWNFGIYRGHVWSIAKESQLDLTQPQGEGNRKVFNPDNPDLDYFEAMAWWAPELLKRNPAMRPELRASMHLVQKSLDRSKYLSNEYSRRLQKLKERRDPAGLESKTSAAPFRRSSQLRELLGRLKPPPVSARPWNVRLARKLSPDANSAVGQLVRSALVRHPLQWLVARNLLFTGALGAQYGLRNMNTDLPAIKPEELMSAKTASTAFSRRVQAGELSPESVQRASSAMPEGQFRFVKHLGQGQFSLADQVVGNVGGHAGEMARKMPIRYTPSYLQEGQATKQFADTVNENYAKRRQFNGLPATDPPIAPYVASTEKGLFQRLATGTVPNIQKDPYVPERVVDLHPENMGKGGQILDASPRSIPHMFRIEKGVKRIGEALDRVKAGMPTIGDTMHRPIIGGAVNSISPKDNSRVLARRLDSRGRDSVRRVLSGDPAGYTERFNQGLIQPKMRIPQRPTPAIKPRGRLGALMSFVSRLRGRPAAKMAVDKVAAGPVIARRPPVARVQPRPIGPRVVNVSYRKARSPVMQRRTDTVLDVAKKTMVPSQQVVNTVGKLVPGVANRRAFMAVHAAPLMQQSTAAQVRTLGNVYRYSTQNPEQALAASLAASQSPSIRRALPSYKQMGGIGAALTGTGLLTAALSKLVGSPGSTNSAMPGVVNSATR